MDRPILFIYTNRRVECVEPYVTSSETLLVLCELKRCFLESIFSLEGDKLKS